MILVDTSVIIDLFHGTKNKPTDLFYSILENKIEYGISVLTYQEVLQGARNESEELQLQNYLGTQKIYHLPNDLSFYNSAARYRNQLRRKGVTIRNTIDILIAATALYYDLKLLHNDRDFAYLVAEIKNLEEYC